MGKSGAPGWFDRMGSKGRVRTYLGPWIGLRIELARMPKKILILDDEGDILEALKRYLERAGHIVTAVGDGQQGLDAAQAQQFDLILTDVVMPVMDGFRFFKEVKKLPSYVKVPVIVMTAHTSMEESFRIFDIAEFLAKPVPMEVILETIERLLKPSLGETKRRSIIVCGANVDVVGSMVQLLNDHGHKATAVHNEIEFLVKALETSPDMVFIDVLLPYLMAHEVIAAMRAFSVFSNLKILTYTNFTEKELTSVDAVEQLKAAKNKCLEAGASAYIGRFSKVTFIDSIKEYEGTP